MTDFTRQNTYQRNFIIVDFVIIHYKNLTLTIGNFVESSGFTSFLIEERVAKIRTANGVLIRSIVTLISVSNLEQY